MTTARPGGGEKGERSAETSKSNAETVDKEEERTRSRGKGRRGILLFSSVENDEREGREKRKGE